MSEPLQIEDSLIYRLTDRGGINADEINVTMWNCSRDLDKRAEGARRVLACVDACTQITTEELESIPSTGGMLGPRADVARIAKQRDELLAAAKNLRDVKGRHHSEQAFKALVEAVAKVEAANA